MSKRRETANGLLHLATTARRSDLLKWLIELAQWSSFWCCTFTHRALPQEDDFGIGYVIPPGGDNMSAVIYYPKGGTSSAAKPKKSQHSLCALLSMTTGVCRLIRIWADYLPKQSMVLRRDRPLRFYSKPDKNSEWKIKLFRYPHSDEYSYVLRPIRREGRWLLVELQTPFDPCGNIPQVIEQDYGVRPRTICVWIEYIDERGRPLVLAQMMC
jgi:hypothetical protein